MQVLATVTAGWAVVMAVAPLLQIRQIVRTATAAPISVAYFVLLCVGFGLWVAYGVASDQPVLEIPNSVALTVAVFTIVVTMRYRRRR
ncbi:MAG: SemiSWEET family sugar transporter [Acidimicrobiales bacterium]